MKSRIDWINEMQQNFSEFIAKTPVADIEKNSRAFMAQAFAKMDLLTREDFDTQTALLERTIQRVAELEKKIEALELSLLEQAPTNDEQ